VEEKRRRENYVSNECGGKGSNYERVCYFESDDLEQIMKEEREEKGKRERVSFMGNYEEEQGRKQRWEEEERKRRRRI